MHPEILDHALYLQGQVAASTQRWQDVAGPLQEMLEQFPESPLRAAASFWIAEALYQQKEYEKAAQWFGKLEPEQLVDETPGRP